ncbi:MAG: transketolase family protein [Caldilineae bacterium]|nr:transketolase family protein [Chloroflexota bacterium]MCB9177559.1 transketolase family protein [Caldilineae bacterium]
MNIAQSIGLEMGSPTRNAFGEALAELGEAFPSLVVVDGDVGNSTRTEWFGERFPERFFNVGIAESNMVGVAAGLASCGHIALTASFAAFLTCNAYDQIRMCVGFPHANVKLVGSHSGISIGQDGPSQMGIEDMALLSVVPEMVVLAPADAPSARTLTRRMLEHVGPVYMRTGRPKVPVVYPGGAEDLVIGRAASLRAGDDLTLIACGAMVAAALVAAARLAEQGIEARVLDMHTIKPIDRAAVVAAATETGGIVTAEEHLLDGGLGSAVARVVAREAPCRMGFVGLDDSFARSGDPMALMQRYGLTAEAIEAEALRVLGRA